MNKKIKKGKNYFEKGNYRKALICFQAVRKDDADYDIAVRYKIYCLVELKEYSEALKIIDSSIAKNNDSEFMWFNKVTCHVFLNEDEKALEAIGEIEHLIDENDISSLVLIAKLYNILNEFDKALIYADRALAIDESFKDAIYQKSYVAIGLEDDEMLDEVADLLLKYSDDNMFDILPVFLLKLFSKKYRQSLNIIENCKDEISPDSLELFKTVVYKRICEDMTVNILTVEECNLSVDVALGILFDFIDFGKDFGTVGDVQYFIT